MLKYKRKPDRSELLHTVQHNVNTEVINGEDRHNCKELLRTKLWETALHAEKPGLHQVLGKKDTLKDLIEKIGMNYRNHDYTQRDCN